MKKGICIVFLDKDRMAKFLEELETTDIKWARGENPTAEDVVSEEKLKKAGSFLKI